MSKETYIVEGTNWKCRVSLESNTEQNFDYKLIEAATRCIEHLFSAHGPQSSVDVIELLDSDGADFFKLEEVDEDKIPDPAFGLLTKVYRLKDINKHDDHYVIRTKTLMENASAYDALWLVDELEQEVKKKNPLMFNSVEKVMRNNLVFRFGDLKKYQQDDS